MKLVTLLFWIVEGKQIHIHHCDTQSHSCEVHPIESPCLVGHLLSLHGQGIWQPHQKAMLSFVLNSRIVLLWELVFHVEYLVQKQ